MSSSDLPRPLLDEIKNWDEQRVIELFQYLTLRLKSGHEGILREQERDGATPRALTENVLLLPHNSQGTGRQQASTKAIDQITLEARINSIEVEIELMKDQLRKKQDELFELQMKRLQAPSTDLSSNNTTVNAIQILKTAINSSSIDGAVTFDILHSELSIRHLSMGSLHIFRNSVTRVLSDIPLRKMRFFNCKNAHPEDVEALIKSATTIENLNLGLMKNMRIKNILQKCSQIQELHLRSDLIDEKGASALAEALKTNTKLQKLDIYGNRIGEKGMNTLAEALKMNTTLQKLNLEFNSIGDQGVSALAEALKINTGLQSLNLKCNNFNKEGTRAIAELLKMDISLQLLNLELNSIDDLGASAIAEALKMNTRLQNLNLENNRIEAKGASVLSEALKVNTALQNLNLKGNRIDDKGASALAEALKMNTTLQNLNVEENNIGEKGASALVNILLLNISLKIVI